MDGAQPPRRTTRIHEPPIRLADYHTSLPCRPKGPNAAVAQSSQSEEANHAQASSAGKNSTVSESSASCSHPEPSLNPPTTEKEGHGTGETASMEIKVMKGEISELKGLILDLGKSVQALGEKVENQCYSGSFNSSRSARSSASLNSEPSPAMCKAQNHPQIVKELHDKLQECNIVPENPKVNHPSPPAPSRVCSLPPPAGSPELIPQVVRPKSSQATQVDWGLNTKQPCPEASCGRFVMNQTCDGRSISTSYSKPSQPPLQRPAVLHETASSAPHALRSVPHLTQASLSPADFHSRPTTASAAQYSEQRHPIKAPVSTQLPASPAATMPASFPALLSHAQQLGPQPAVNTMPSAVGCVDAPYAQVPYGHPPTVSIPPPLPQVQPPGGWNSQ